MNTAMTTSYKKSAATGKLFNTSSSLQERSEGRRWEEDCIAVWHHHDTWGEQSQNQNQNQSEHQLRRGRRLSTRSQRTVREHSLSGSMFNWDRSYNHLLSCDSLQWCHLMMHAGELHSAECNQMISVRITRQTELQTHPINTLMLSRHASTFSWWKSHLQLMMVWKEETDSTQTVRSLQRRSLPHLCIRESLCRSLKLPCSSQHEVIQTVRRHKMMNG